MHQTWRYSQCSPPINHPGCSQTAQWCRTVNILQDTQKEIYSKYEHFKKKVCNRGRAPSSHFKIFTVTFPIVVALGALIKLCSISKFLIAFLYVVFGWSDAIGLSFDALNNFKDRPCSLLQMYSFGGLTVYCFVLRDILSRQSIESERKWDFQVWMISW